jgi:peptidoglycan/LPS O-acetylase OafA/YrhL
MQQSASRNFGLDVLRGLAILLVLTHHLALPFRLPLGGGLAEDAFGRRVVGVLSYSGLWAVYLFFVLSGFLIARRCIDQFGSLDRIDWRLFYRQRAKRIVPLLAVLLVFISVLHFLQVPHFTINKEGQTWAGAFFSAVFLHLNWYEGQTTWLPAAWDVLWSLSIEEVFYIAFPLACLWLPGRLLIPALLALAISLPWTRDLLEGQEIWQDKAYLPGFSAIAFGVLTAMLSQHWRPSQGLLRSFAIIGVCALILCLYFSGIFWSRWLNTSMLIFCTVAAIGIYGASLAWQEPHYWMRVMFGWLARLGQLSYELYLTHMLVQIPFVAFVQSYLANQKYYWFLSYPIAILLCFLTALLAQHVVSKQLGDMLFPSSQKATIANNSLKASLER